MFLKPTELHQLCIPLFGKQFISPFKFPKKNIKEIFPQHCQCILSNTDDKVVHRLYGDTVTSATHLYAMVMGNFSEFLLVFSVAV